MPIDVPTLLVFRHLARKRAAAAQGGRAARQAPLAALRGSPLAVVLSAPLAHPSAYATAKQSPTPHLTTLTVSKPVASDSGVKHPTPAEVAAQTAKASIAQAQAILAGIVSKADAWKKAHPRPSPTAQPATIAAWLKAGGLSPREQFPEWQWTVIRKTATPLGSLLGSLVEPGEAIATVQLGPNDVVVWYEHPAGAWSYTHHWGQDIGQVLASVANAITTAISDAAHAVSTVVSAVTSVVGTVLQYAQIAASLVPGLGQVVNEVVSVAEAAIDAIEGESALAIAFDTAYHAVLASVPGLEALGPFLSPMVDFLKNLINGGMKGLASVAIHSALGDALKQVPDAPSVGAYSPRSIAASLAGWVLSKLGIH